MDTIESIRDRYQRWKSENLLGNANESSLSSLDKIKLDLLELIKGKKPEESESSRLIKKIRDKYISSFEITH